MHVMRFCSALACGALLLIPPLALAQDSDIPAYTVLKCEAGCSPRTRPTADGSHRGYYPGPELHVFPQYKSEAFVLIRYTITAEGTVKDPVVEKLIGPQDFADGSVEAVKEWRYHPATMNGRPVPTYNWTAVMTYRFEPPERGARDKVYDAYGKARALLKEGKFAEAKAVLLPILSLDRLNFYERSMVSYLLALTDVQLKDYITAREFIEDATLSDGEFLGDTARIPAIRLRIEIDGLTGQFGDAMEWYGKLRKRTDVAPDDLETKLVDRIEARLADPKPLFIVGRIPVSGYLDEWSHVLLRRNFAFPAIEGKIDRFEMRCDQEEIESAVTDKAEWHVPKSWSNCHLTVFGKPGASFQLVETSD
jgi:TonB family protein